MALLIEQVIQKKINLTLKNKIEKIKKRKKIKIIK